MFKEIEELEPKYFILKVEDIQKYLTKEDMDALHDLSMKISSRRKREGKTENEYVVLNLDDEFATGYINTKWTEFVWHRLNGHFDEENGEWNDGPFEPATIREIAPMLVNSILRAEYQKSIEVKH